MKLSITALLPVAATVAALSTSSAVDAFTTPSTPSPISLISSRSRSMIGRSNLHMSAASNEDAAADSNKGVSSGNVAKTPVVGLPRPMEIGPQTPEEVKAKFGDRQLVVITGCSSGLGRKTAQALLATNRYHVVGAVRDIDKMDAVAEIDNWPLDKFTTMHCELNSFDSVREFCERLEKWRGAKPIDRLICNAGVYQPSLPYAKWSADGHEQTMQINFLSHFLMISLLMEGMKEASDPRIITVGSVTGNDNTVGGGGVYPIADLKQLEGFKAGFSNPISMADGYGFDGAKAYKDSKLCLMMLANILHAKFHKSHGIAFSSIYPGCIAESPLFREKRAWFRKYFPIFMKYITGGFVGEEEAGQRLFQVAHDPRCGERSGIYWSWNGGPREGRGAEALEKDGQISGGGGAGGGWDSIYENEQSAKVQNIDTTVDLFTTATAITGAKWPNLADMVEPAPPTLKVIGSISKNKLQSEEAKRRSVRPGLDESTKANDADRSDVPVFSEEDKAVLSDIIAEELASEKKEAVV